MHHIRRGAGPKLLLIHGLGGSWQSWTPILDGLSASQTVIAIDLPGHGATPAEPDSGTFNGLVGSVERYIANNGLAGIDLVGSSMGARIVLELARRGGVGNVIALDPGGFWRGWERRFSKPPSVPQCVCSGQFGRFCQCSAATRRHARCCWRNFPHVHGRSTAKPLQPNSRDTRPRRRLMRWSMILATAPSRPVLPRRRRAGL